LTHAAALGILELVQQDMTPDHPEYLRLKVEPRAAIARYNRLAKRRGSSLHFRTSKSKAEKEVGQWLLVDVSCVMAGYDHAGLEAYLKKVGAMHPDMEYLDT